MKKSKFEHGYIYFVVKDGKMKSYDTDSQAYYAAQQTGGEAYSVYIPGYNWYPITEKKMKARKRYDRLHPKG